jgi:carbonic anhydrase
MRDMISLTAEEIAAFSSRMGNNNRPVQKLYARQIALDNFSTITTK